jgi:hypothetical protein
MGSVVVIHKGRRCIQRVIIKVRHNTCFKDVLSIDLSIAVASYCNEVKLTVIKERTPLVQTLNELKQTLHQEWQRLTQVQIRHLVGSMRRRLAAVIRVNGSYTHY